MPVLRPDVAIMADQDDATYLDGGFSPNPDAGKIVVAVLPAALSCSIRATSPTTDLAMSLIASDAADTTHWVFDIGSFAPAVDPVTFTMTASGLDFSDLGDGPYAFWLQPASWEAWYGESRLHDWWITIGVSTPPPLRQVQRDDGLGRSTTRARGGTSVQRSIRQRGYR